LNPLISWTIAPIVILIHLFIVVLVIGRHDQRLGRFHLRPGTVIFTGAAFFIALIVAHNSLRAEVKVPGFVYLESLYILTYFAILIVAIDSVLLLARPNLRLFRNCDNMWIAVFYWPTILLTMVIVTFLMFR
jgi:hypothetical protein